MAVIATHGTASNGKPGSERRYRFWNSTLPAKKSTGNATNENKYTHAGNISTNTYYCGYVDGVYLHTTKVVCLDSSCSKYKICRASEPKQGSIYGILSLGEDGLPCAYHPSDAWVMALCKNNCKQEQRCSMFYLGATCHFTSSFSAWH